MVKEHRHNASGARDRHVRLQERLVLSLRLGRGLVVHSVMVMMVMPVRVVLPVMGMMVMVRRRCSLSHGRRKSDR
jgi:hypothetical protein